ncbi:hypothetical protein HDU76_006037, partial [Blyttiomyces sp. JEL0837]
MKESRAVLEEPGYVDRVIEFAKHIYRDVSSEQYKRHVEQLWEPLPAGELHHLTHVRRMKENDKVWVTDGSGSWIACILKRGKQKKSWGVCPIIETPTSASTTTPTPTPSITILKSPPSHPITLEIGMTKLTRFDWVIEKATELGISKIQPILCDFSGTAQSSTHVAIGKWIERGRLVSLQALKQCERGYVVDILEPVKVDKLNVEALRLLAVEPSLRGGGDDKGGSSGDGGRVLRFSEALDEIIRNKLWPDLQSDKDIENGKEAVHLHLCVGPEGGWSPNEMAWFRERAGTSTRHVGLGDGVLRAETAAIVGLESRRIVSVLKMNGGERRLVKPGLMFAAALNDTANAGDVGSSTTMSVSTSTIITSTSMPSTTNSQPVTTSSSSTIAIGISPSATLTQVTSPATSEVVVVPPTAVPLTSSKSRVSTKTEPSAFSQSQAQTTQSQAQFTQSQQPLVQQQSSPTGSQNINVPVINTGNEINIGTATGNAMSFGVGNEMPTSSFNPQQKQPDMMTTAANGVPLSQPTLGGIVGDSNNGGGGGGGFDESPGRMSRLDADGGNSNAKGGGKRSMGRRNSLLPLVAANGSPSSPPASPSIRTITPTSTANRFVAGANANSGHGKGHSNDLVNNTAASLPLQQQQQPQQQYQLVPVTASDAAEMVMVTKRASQESTWSTDLFGSAKGSINSNFQKYRALYESTANEMTEEISMPVIPASYNTNVTNNLGVDPDLEYQSREDPKNSRQSELDIVSPVAEQIRARWRDRESLYTSAGEERDSVLSVPESLQQLTGRMDVENVATFNNGAVLPAPGYHAINNGNPFRVAGSVRTDSMYSNVDEGVGNNDGNPFRNSALGNVNTRAEVTQSVSSNGGQTTTATESKENPFRP